MDSSLTDCVTSLKISLRTSQRVYDFVVMLITVEYHKICSVLVLGYYATCTCTCSNGRVLIKYKVIILTIMPCSCTGTQGKGNSTCTLGVVVLLQVQTMVHIV